MSEGSMLYHPAGIWHKVECSEDSISINVSLISTNWSELITSSIHHHLLSVDEFREPIYFRNPAEARQKLASLLQMLPAKVAELKVNHILPHPMFYPRLSIVRVTRGENEGLRLEGVPEKFPAQSRFKKNPLAQLVAAEMPSKQALRQMIDGRKPDDVVDDDEEEEEPLEFLIEDYLCWALHINFGNENFESQGAEKKNRPKKEMVSAVAFR